MPAKLIDGKGIADAVIANIYEQVSALGVPLHLAAICPRNDFELKSFIKLKQKAAQAAGITFSSYFFEAESQDDFMATLDYISSDDTVDGMFVELPLPEGWDREKVLSHIPISKDVDVISPAGERAFYSDESVVLPPSVKALEYALMECGLELSGANCAVIGQGRLIGLPISHWLESQGATVARIDIDTLQPRRITEKADLIVTGTGSPELVKGQWVRDGAVVIDFGFGRNAKGALTGDVELSSVSKQAAFLTPVPGGMGPLVIAAVLENLVTLAAK